MNPALQELPVYRPSARLLRTLLSLVVVGAVVFVVGLVAAPERAWPGFLVAFTFLAGMGVAGLLFIAALHLANAGWATSLRRIPEAMAGTIRWTALLGILLIMGVPQLYEWSHAEVLEHDAILQGKSVWLNHGLFAARLVLFFAAWWAFAHVFRKRSRLQDAGKAPSDDRRRNLKTSALFFAVFAVTWSFASFDWLMSLEPHWFSTIYALYTLAGLACAGLAGGIICLVHLRRTTPMRSFVTDDQLHDLGKLLLSFSVFWVYIWYCQYMLIWYSDIPEETTWYLARSAGTWKSLTPVNLALNWLVPFIVLLPRAMKRSEGVLVRIAWVVLIGRLLDLYILVGPPLMGDRPVFGLWEAGPIVAAAALFFYLVLRGLSRASLVPMRDPYLPESQHYHA